MKTVKILLIFIFYGTVVNSQITINSGDIANVGDTVIQSEDANITSFSPGGTGEQTWDFSNLTPSNNDTILFVDISGAPEYQNYPDADFAVEILGEDGGGNPDTTFMFIDKTDDYLNIEGAYIPDLGNVPFVPFQKIMPFPVTYGDEFYSEYYNVLKTYSGTDSIMFKSYVNDTINVNAYGTVSMTSGNYESLRFYHKILQKDSVFIKNADSWILVNDTVKNKYRYEWWTNNPDVKMKIAEFETDEFDNVIGGDFMSKAFIHYAYVRQTENNNLKILYLADGKAYIKNIPEGFNLLSVYDMSGKQILSKQIISENYRLNLQNIPKGIYIISISSQKAKIGKKILIK